MNAAGCLQLCAGQRGGCEAAVHAMKKLFDGALLVDASNALNQWPALLHMFHLCPSFATILTTVTLTTWHPSYLLTVPSYYPLGSVSLVTNFTENQVAEWCDDMSQLTTIAETQLHTAYSMVFCLSGTFFFIPFLSPLEPIISF